MSLEQRVTHLEALEKRRKIEKKMKRKLRYINSLKSNKEILIRTAVHLVQGLKFLLINEDEGKNEAIEAGVVDEIDEAVVDGQVACSSTASVPEEDSGVEVEKSQVSEVSVAAPATDINVTDTEELTLVGTPESDVSRPSLMQEADCSIPVLQLAAAVEASGSNEYDPPMLEPPDKIPRVAAMKAK
ncbi:hypothetical protein HHI36_003698 [Cryptolaemus montrouzieri]|uniref:Uncharacterized protein n=1 Tax=Cryptolaemus montrouzieri TaxID=559131 RepID=A0ABD2PEM3_9CUCU